MQQPSDARFDSDDGSSRAERGGQTSRPPWLGRGVRVGLMGGSFNPPHDGHLAAAALARRACRLDRVALLVTPGSPLKAAGGYAPLGERVAATRALTRGRAWLTVSDAEARLGTHYTADTLAALIARGRGARLVWIMGADSLASFHLWRDWRGIAARVPILVVSRPGANAAALTSPAARALWRSRLPASDAGRLAGLSPPAWCFLPTLSHPASSTALRARRLYL